MQYDKHQLSKEESEFAKNDANGTSGGAGSMGRKASCPSDNRQSEKLPRPTHFGADPRVQNRLKSAFSNSESEIKVEKDKSPIIPARRRAR
jgi:hypothetical protein